MNILVAGLVLFFAIHLLPCAPSVRGRAITLLGQTGYKLVFTAISLGGVALIAAGKAWAPFIAVWSPVPAHTTIAMILMAPVFMLLAGANMPGNLKRYIRHPMLCGVALWSLAHLLSNGDLASALLFGSFGAYALFDIVSSNMRGASKSTQIYPLKKDVIVVAAGALVYVVVLFAHPYLFRMPVLI